jgi:transcription initiation factor TFIIIB Brf1 subunit/transcription initiation factor TFIIB
MIQLLYTRKNSDIKKINSSTLMPLKPKQDISFGSKQTSEYEISFQGQRWGIVGTMGRYQGGNHFHYPLRVTVVRYESEAYHHQVLVGDTITAVCVDGIWHESRTDNLSEKGCLFVSIQVTNALIGGGRCFVRFQRTCGRKCGNCRQDALFDNTQQGDITCTNCGMVDQERVPSRLAEWRNFDDDDVNQNRVGSFQDNNTMEPTTMNDKSALFWANLKLAGTSKHKTEFACIGQVCNALDMPLIVMDRAHAIAMLARTVSQGFRWSSQYLALSAVRLASVECAQTRTLKDIATAAGIFTLGKFRRELKRVTVIVNNDRSKRGLDPVRSHAIQHVQRILQLIPTASTTDAIHSEAITQQAELDGITSKSGNTIAAAAIYMTQLNKHQLTHDTTLLASIAQGAGITENTVLRSYNQLLVSTSKRSYVQF